MQFGSLQFWSFGVWSFGVWSLEFGSDLRITSHHIISDHDMPCQATTSTSVGIGSKHLRIRAVHSAS